MTTSIQTILDQANTAIASIGSSLITLQNQSDLLNVTPAAVNTTISGANTSNIPTPYYTKSESDVLYLSNSGGTVTGNISATKNIFISGNTVSGNVYASGYYFANGTPFVSGGGGGVSWQPVQNSSFIAVSGNGYLVNTKNSGVVVTLPSTPVLGNYLQIVDYSKTAFSNSITIYPNGSKLNSNTSNVSLSTNGSSVALVYTDSVQGWIAFGGFNVSPVGNYSIEYLSVAGGGGGGSGYESSGGGAGGFLAGTTTIVPGTTYTITIGAGGAGVPGSTIGWLNQRAASGTDTSFSSLILSIGGGGGASTSSGSGASGGSGGGGARGGSGGVGTVGQGNSGGISYTGGPNYGGAGGGGASAAGTNGGSTGAGSGGAGLSSSISGSTTYYAGGGGGCVYAGGSGGAGGNGGGGAGGAGFLNVGTSGTTNSGGGAGAGGGDDNQSPSYARAGGNGGSGIFILRYLGPQRASGGTITTNGVYTTHTFTSSGTFQA